MAQSRLYGPFSMVLTRPATLLDLCKEPSKSRVGMLEVPAPGIDVEYHDPFSWPLIS